MRQRLSVSQVVIGALETGFGRSTPELAVNVKSALAGDTDLALGNLLGSNLIKIGGVACLVAAHKRNTDMVIGNVLGSNLFNIFFVLAITSMIAPVPVDGSMNRVILANLALALALWVPAWFRAGKPLGRGGGALLLAGYGAYLAVSLL